MKKSLFAIATLVASASARNIEFLKNNPSASLSTLVQNDTPVSVLLESKDREFKLHFEPHGRKLSGSSEVYGDGVQNDFDRAIEWKAQNPGDIMVCEVTNRRAGCGVNEKRFELDEGDINNVDDFGFKRKKIHGRPYFKCCISMSRTPKGLTTKP